MGRTGATALDPVSSGTVVEIARCCGYASSTVGHALQDGELNTISLGATRVN